MNQNIADEFIAKLNSTIKDYEGQRDKVPGLGSLLDVSSHMIDALGVLNAKMPSEEDRKA